MWSLWNGKSVYQAGNQGPLLAVDDYLAREGTTIDLEQQIRATKDGGSHLSTARKQLRYNTGKEQKQGWWRSAVAKSGG